MGWHKVSIQMVHEVFVCVLCALGTVITTGEMESDANGPPP